MIKFIITSIILTWIWIWSFMKIVVEENQTDKVPRVYTTNSTVPVYEENTFMLPPRPTSKINHNPLVMMWFGSFTYLMTKIWNVWIHFIFGLNPHHEDEDEIEENDARANDDDSDY